MDGVRTIKMRRADLFGLSGRFPTICSLATVLWLARRYARLLCMPDWEPEELLELGPGLSTYVSSWIYKKRVIERRLKW